MNAVTKLLRVIGFILLYLGVAVIVFGLGTTWYFNGFSALRDVMNPFNIINFVTMAITVAPGGILIGLSDWLKKRSEAAGKNK